MLPEAKARHRCSSAIPWLEAELLAPVDRSEQFVKLSREFAEIDSVVDAKIKAYREVAGRAGRYLEALIADPKPPRATMREMADDELAHAASDKRRRRLVAGDSRLALLPKDAMDDRNVVLEIRAGTGGDEASLFAGDLFRMYERFAALQGWKVEVISASPKAPWAATRKSSPRCKGRGAFAKLKFESGVHRVQRVPDTETQGRMSTPPRPPSRYCPKSRMSTSTSRSDDLKIDTMRAQGAGGQHVNKTEVGDPHHPFADRHRGDDAGQPLATQKSGVGDEHPAFADLRRRATTHRRGALRGTQARRSAPAIAPSASGPIIFRKAASPITAST